MASQLAQEFTPREGEKSLVTSVLSYEEPVIGRKLISSMGPDGQAVLVVLQLSTELVAVDNIPFLSIGSIRGSTRFSRSKGFPKGSSWV